MTLGSADLVRAKRDEILGAAGYLKLLLGNDAEYCALAEEQDAPMAFWRLCERLPDLDMVMTAGADGAYGRFNGGRPFRVEALPVGRIVNTLGAGDAFAAGLLHSLHLGLPPEKAVGGGCYYAAQALQVAGARLPRAFPEYWERPMPVAVEHL